MKMNSIAQPSSLSFPFISYKLQCSILPARARLIAVKELDIVLIR